MHVNDYYKKVKDVYYINVELGELGKHGITLPPNMQGLTEDQISDLKLHDTSTDKCVPSGGIREVKDPMSKRNGQGMFNNGLQRLNKATRFEGRGSPPPCQRV